MEINHPLNVPTCGTPNPPSKQSHSQLWSPHIIKHTRLLTQLPGRSRVFNINQHRSAYHIVFP